MLNCFRILEEEYKCLALRSALHWIGVVSSQVSVSLAVIQYEQSPR